MNIGSDRRCELTDKGKKALSELLNLVYENKKLDLLVRVTGLSKQPVINILSCIEPSKQDKPVSLESFGIFFRTLFLKLNLAQQTQYKNKYPGLQLISDSPYIDNKYCKQIEESERARLKRTQAMADLLCTLDYSVQENLFKERIRDVYSQAIAFSVSAPCKPTQHWLMYRLLRLASSSGMDKATTIILDRAQPNLSEWNLSTICTEIANTKSLGIEHREPSKVIEDLAAYNRAYRPVLIKVSGLQNKAERDVLIKEFWQKLTQYLPLDSQKLSSRARESRSILFLLEDRYSDLTSDTFFSLQPPEITIDTVDEWLSELKVKETLQKYRKQLNLYNLVDTHMPKWSCWQQQESQLVLYESLKELCKLFSVEYRLTELEHRWKNGD